MDQQNKTDKSRKRRTWPWVLGIGTAVVVLGSAGMCALFGMMLSLAVSGEQATWHFGDAVGIIYVEGPIGVSSVSSVASVNSSTVIHFIEQAEANSSVKAIVLYINSPGGAVVPSAEMYHAVKQAKKPVVAVMGDVAASGGYYIAAGADKILAHPATITGSIGVYGQLVNAAELLEKLGVEGIIIRSGDSKAVGNWYERPTEEQIAIEQAIVDELHDMFVLDVTEGRDMAENEVRALADGRPYTGKQALELGLIDMLGSLGDAIDQAARLGNIDGEPEIIEYRHEPSFTEMLLTSQQAKQQDPLLQQWFDLQLYALPQMLYLGQ
ncbi:MAG: signal peptide peptidase SppA [Anaerolineae bacterium]|nr:signal peptide peptidase SppA [Anaerolineae bacterium]